MKSSKFNNFKHRKKMIKEKGDMFQINKSLIKTTVLSLFVSVFFMGSSQNIFSQPRTLAGNDVSEKQLIPIPIEDFEKPVEWKAIATPYDPNKINSYADLKFVDGRPSDLGDLPAKKVLGIKFQFRYPGYNFITMFPPPLKNPNGTDAVDPVTLDKVGPALEMPGRAEQISVWVMSQGKDYTLEGYIRDFKGDTHRILFGSLKYVGWRPLVANIPTNIPQGVGSYPQTKTLKFIKFVIRSTRKTSTEPVYLFFDQIKILTNKFDVHFSGAEIDTNWGSKLSQVKGMIESKRPQ